MYEITGFAARRTHTHTHTHIHPPTHAHTHTHKATSTYIHTHPYYPNTQSDEASDKFAVYEIAGFVTAVATLVTVSFFVDRPNSAADVRWEL